MYDRCSSNAAVCTHVCHTAVRRSSIRYRFLQKKKKQLCHWSAFQQSDDASKYRHPFKCPCQKKYILGSRPPPPLPAVQDSHSTTPLVMMPLCPQGQLPCHDSNMRCGSVTSRQDVLCSTCAVLLLVHWQEWGLRRATKGSLLGW